MNRTVCGRLAAALIVLLATTGFASAAGDGAGPVRTSMKTVTGVVESLAVVPAEGGIDVVRVTLILDEKTGASLDVLLAPEGLMDEIGFTVQEGDRLKVKYFLDEEGPARAHKVLNTTRGSMVRFRTLRQIPLWSNQGAWQGGAARSQPGNGGDPTRGGRN
ncbi:MAG: hypothetical protein IFK94_09745 [Acidobacteria bacterium]|uniref:DUF5666 domain-containing protein n=1 Tax=Candidatus Polarisedimenticola svalbardensis TaxID=2886004 RepID=A0A8J6XZP8_9BACT|nr:hypothetical protein [Candidatus Polarisedimenticola svalbardensis]